MPTPIEKIFEDVQLHVKFTQASSRSNIVTYDSTASEPENISTAFGKLSKWYEALVPTGGSSGKILAWNSSGTAKWSDPLHPAITLSADTTSTPPQLAHSGTFTAITSVTRDSNGHVTKLNTATYTLPASGVPSNNVTGSGTSGYLTKWNGTNTITNGPQLGSSTTTFLRNDGTWATPVGTTYSAGNHLSLSSNTFSVASYAKDLTGGDWNSVVANGWYMGHSCTNAPSTAWWIGHVHAHNNKYCIQELWAFNDTPPDTANPDAMFMGHKMRWFRNSTWGPWVDVSTPTPSAKVNCQWGTAASRTTNVTRGWMAYWDGSFDGSSSNLTYCNRGAFGTIVTKNTGDYVPNTQAGMNAAINLLSTGTSNPALADYYIAQWANGGTTTTTYHRRPISALWNTFKELITLETTGSGNAVTAVSIANDGDHNRKITVTKGSTFSLSTHTHNYAGSSSAGGPALSVSTAGGDVVLGTPSSSSNDSGDIYWKYGNGQEKARLWLDDTYTAKAGPAYRIYKSDGTALYNGRLPLADGTSASGTWGISITGNASTSTKATQDGDGNTISSTYLRARSTISTDGGATGWSQIGINQYNAAYPDGVTNKIYSYGAVVSMPAPNARFDLYYNHNSSTADRITNGLQYRTGWNDDKKAWRMLIDNVNYTEYMPYKKPIKFQFNNGITNGYWAKLFSANYSDYNILEIDIVTYHGYDGNFRSKLHIRFTRAGFVPGESSIISHQNIAPGSLRITQDDTNTFSLWIKCDGISSRFGYEILNISDESSVFFNGVTLTAARWSFPTTFTKSDTAPTNAVTATRYFALDNHTHNFTDPTVTQTADNSSNSDSYELLISNSANNTTETAGVRKSTRLRFNPSTGRVIMQGPLIVRATDGVGSYDEGIRINAGKNGFSSLSFGGGQDTISGTADGQFWVGTNSTNDSFKRKLYIAHTASTGSGTYFYASSATQVSPALKLGTSGSIASGNGDAVTGGVVYTALSNYLPLSGGSLSGPMNLKSTTYDGSAANNGVSSGIAYPTTFNILDKSSRILVRLEGVINSSGSIGSYWYVRNYNTSGTHVGQKGISMTMAKDGTLTYAVSDGDKFRSAIGAGTSSLTIGTTSTTAAAGDHAHGLLHSNLTQAASNGTTGGWSVIGIDPAVNGYVLKSIRINQTSPNWLSGDYGAGIAFGGYDTKGVISMNYHLPTITFAGGNHKSSKTEPVWYLKISGTSGSTYNLDNLLSTTLLKVSESTNLMLDGETNAFGYVSGLTKDTWNFQQTDGTIIRQRYNTLWKTEIFMDYRTGQMSTRGKNKGTWQDWRIHLDSGNYTSYTVTKTGSGASGTWGISITGNVTGNVNGKLYNTGTSSSWWNDRDNAVIRITTGDTNYRPLWTLLTATSGSWGMGNYTGDDLTFNFISKAVYDSKKNPSTNTQIKFTNTGAITANGLTLSSSDYGPLSIIRTGNPWYAGIKFYNNGSTYLGSFGITTVNGRFVRFNTDEATSYEIIDRSVVRNNTTVGTLGWTSVSADTVIPTVNTIAYWNGAHSGTSSNLAYCKKGAFGTIITKNTGDYVPNHGDLRSTIGSDCPAADVKTFFMTSSVPTATSSIGYNTSGNEYTLIFGKGTNTNGYGAVLKFGYNSLYPLMLRVQNGTWKSTDWEKISAGYADRTSYLDVIAGNEIRLYNDNQFNRNYHFWIGYSWAQGSHYTPSGGTDTASTTAPNITKYVMGNCSGGGLAGIHVASLILGQGDTPTASSAASTLKASAQGTTGTYLLPSIGNGTYTLSCGHEDLSAVSGSLTSTNVTVPSYTKFIKIVFKSDSSNTLYSMVEIPYFGNGDYSALVQVGTYADGYQGSPRVVMKAVIINIANGSETGKKTFTITVSPTTKINGSNVSDYTRNISIYKIYASD